jgi:carbon storage regulator
MPAIRIGAVLVVTRKRNEAIIIGDAIEVRVLRVGRDGVRLGVTAPLHVPVHRTEIYKLICEENRAAAEGAVMPGDLADRLRRHSASDATADAGPDAAESAAPAATKR